MLPSGNLYGVLQALILLANTALGLWIARRVANVHHEMNSMKDELVDSVRDAATQRGHTAGMKEGQAQAQAQADTAALKVIAEPVSAPKQGESVTLEAPVKIEVTTKKEN